MEIDYETCQRARLSRDPRLVPGEYTLRLAYRPPYDWAALLAFLEARATPDVEAVVDGAYVRTIRLGAQTGHLQVEPAPGMPALVARIRLPDSSSLFPAVERLRRMFDLDADPNVIARHLGKDPLLNAFPGTDLVVKRALGGKNVEARAESWRPWRAYAAMLLWRSV